MHRFILLAGSALLFAGAAFAQRASDFDSADATRQALAEALEERAAAEDRSRRLEAEADDAQTEAERAARASAALAARVQEAEAGIVAARARMALLDEERGELRETLGREQQPLIRLTAALQQFSRRPVALSVLRSGEISDIVYLRAMLHNTLPVVEENTASLRSQINRAAALREATEETAASLRAEEQALAERRAELADIESARRLSAREAESAANREAERALALAEQARDLEGLVEELESAASLRARLAALPGPELRPGSASGDDVPGTPSSGATPADGSAPRPYLLPVTGRTVTGFGASQAAGLSQGLTLAPLAGAQVIAPAAGRVGFAGSYRGFGQIVIIEHEGGWTSLVTGLARTDVRVGQELVGGAPLGIAGPNRPEVTLELRRDGEPVNPLLYTR